LKEGRERKKEEKGEREIGGGLGDCERKKGGGTWVE
jgi:hypothetical protein